MDASGINILYKGSRKTAYYAGTMHVDMDEGKFTGQLKSSHIGTVHWSSVIAYDVPTFMLSAFHGLFYLIITIILR
jgi:hypothetical protein